MTNHDGDRGSEDFKSQNRELKLCPVHSSPHAALWEPFLSVLPTFGLEDAGTIAAFQDVASLLDVAGVLDGIPALTD